MRDHEVDAHNRHFLVVWLFSAEAVVWNYGVGELFGRLDESLEGGFRLVFVNTKQVGQRSTDVFWALFVLQNSPAETHVVVRVNPHC